MANGKDEDRAGPRNFATTLAELSGGDFNKDLGTEQQKLLSTLQDQALEAGKDSKFKGTITITLKYEVTGRGTVSIAPSMTVKAPRPGHAPTHAWVDKAANITWQDPRQGMLNLRDVSAQSVTLREIPTETIKKN
jgi:hypothetical protein